MAEEPTIEQTGYLNTSDADALAATLLDVASYLAATGANKQKALNQASVEIDRAMSYQGRKYDPTQALEFPRVAYESPVDSVQLLLPNQGTRQTIWDWDDDAGEAVVPDDVLAACVYQANSLLAGDRTERLDAQHDQVASHGADGLQESYSGPASVLCRRAHLFLGKYRLKTGRLI